MFETVPRRVTVYTFLDVVEGTVDLNAAGARLTDWLGGGHDWLVLRDAIVTPRGRDLAVDVPLVRVNLASVECLVAEDDHVGDVSPAARWVPARIDARFPSGLIVSGDIALPEGATWVTAVDVIDDDDRLKPLANASLIRDRQVVRSGVTALVRLKAAAYLHEETGHEVVSRLVEEAAPAGEPG